MRWGTSRWQARRREGAGLVPGFGVGPRVLAIGLGAAIALLAGCGRAGNGPPAQGPAARFLGVAPCIGAGCAGEHWDLELFDDNGSVLRPRRYSLRRTRLEASGATTQAQEVQGEWSLADALVRGHAVPAFRLVPADGTATITLQRSSDGVLRLPGTPSNPRGWTLLQTRVPRQAGTLDAVAADAAVPIRLRRGQVLRVHLQDSPATGYHWDLQAELPRSLRLEAEPSQLPKDATVEAPDERGWTFRALRPDILQLRFDYRRSWDGNANPRDAIVFDLHVD